MSATANSVYFKVERQDCNVLDRSVREVLTFLDSNSVYRFANAFSEDVLWADSMDVRLE